MSLKKLIKGLLLTYGAVALIDRHGDDVANWLEKKAIEIGRKAGESYSKDTIDQSGCLVFKRAQFSDMRKSSRYYAKVGSCDFDLLEYIFFGTPSDISNFETYDCYILVEE